MNVNLTGISSNRGINGIAQEHRLETQKPLETKNIRALFGEDALTVSERDILSLNEVSGMDVEALEEALNREDALGMLASSHLTWEPPEMPDFV